MPQEIMYLIENNRRRIQLMKQAARLLYKEWFVYLHFPGHEHVNIKDGVPEGGTPATIADIWRVVTGKTPSKKKESYYGDDIPFIKTPDMHGNTLVISTDESLSEEGANTQANKTLPTRSILVSCLGPWVRLRLTDQHYRSDKWIVALLGVFYDEGLETVTGKNGRRRNYGQCKQVQVFQHQGCYSIVTNARPVQFVCCEPD